MPKAQTERHMHMGSMGMPGGGMHGGGMNEGGGEMDMGALAQHVAPLVAKLLSEHEANSMSTESAGAYVAAGVHKHDEESDAGKHTSNTADAAESDNPKMKQDEASSDFGGSEQGAEKEDFKGKKLDEDDMALKSTAASPEMVR